MFIKYLTSIIPPPKKSRGKGLQGKKTADTTEEIVDVSEESDFEPARKRTAGRRVVKKKVTISADDNIIPDPDVSLELGKSTSLTEAAEEEAARQGVQNLTLDEQLAADTIQALKESKKTSRRQLGTGTKPGVLDEEKVTSEANVIIEWGFKQESKYIEEDNDDETIKCMDTDEEEEKNDGDDNKSIDLEQTDDEETDDEFVHGEEHVQDDNEETDDEFVHGDEQVNDDEDKEMKNAKVEEFGNGDEEIPDAAKADAEKTEEVKDDTKKVELPPTSFSLSVSSDAKINSLLDIKIQSEVPHIQSPSVLTIPVLVISKPSVLSPIPETPSVAPITTLLPPPYVSTIPLILLQTTTPIPIPPTTTEAPTVTIAIPESDALTIVQLRVAKLENDVSELKKIDHSAEALASLKSQVPIVVDNYLGSKIGGDLQKLGDDEDDDEDPSAGPNQGKKTKKRRTKESESSMKPSTTKETSRGKASSKSSKTSKSATAKEPVEELIGEVEMDDVINTAAKDVVHDSDQPHDDSTQAKDKDPKKDWFKPPPRLPTPD
ncbi:hypothetical protein Tco_0783418 [Tanacetum coccineum]